jgi:hypothetical protein
MYEKLLVSLGWKPLCAALEDIMATRRGSDRFPSVADIRGKIIPAVNVDAEAIEAANRILEAIRIHGYNQPAKAQEFMGEIAWLIVERQGGWLTLCEDLQVDQVPTVRAQWRELAKSLILRRQSGADIAPPALPPRGRQELKAAIPPPEKLGSILQRVVSGAPTNTEGTNATKTTPHRHEAPAQGGQTGYRESSPNPHFLRSGEN